MEIEKVRKLAEQYTKVKEADTISHLKAIVCVSSWEVSVLAESMLVFLRRQKSIDRQVKKLNSELKKLQKEIVKE